MKVDDNDDSVFSDAEVHSVQRLIAAQYPQVTGLMEPADVHCAAVEGQAGTPPSTQDTGDSAVSVQILCVNGNHWVAVSCVAGVVMVSARTLLDLNVQLP